MKLSAKDQSYFEKKVQPNIPPKALETLIRKHSNIDKWENKNFKIIHFEYRGEEIYLTIYDQSTKQLLFYKIEYNGIIWKSTCINHIRFLKG